MHYQATWPVSSWKRCICAGGSFKSAVAYFVTPKSAGPPKCSLFDNKAVPYQQGESSVPCQKGRKCNFEEGQGCALPVLIRGKRVALPARAILL